MTDVLKGYLDTEPPEECQGKTQTQEWPCEDESSHWNNAATSQGMPGATIGWRKQGRLSSRVFRGNMATTL